MSAAVGADSGQREARRAPRTSLPCAANPWTMLRATSPDLGCIQTEACGMTPSAVSEFFVSRYPGDGRASGAFCASVLACAGVSMAQTRAGDHPLPYFHDSTNWGGRARAGGTPRVTAGGHAVNSLRLRGVGICGHTRC
ncbi:uncharacterized protein LOC144339598 [Macaca mulatta]